MPVSGAERPDDIASSNRPRLPSLGSDKRTTLPPGGPFVAASGRGQTRDWWVVLDDSRVKPPDRSLAYARRMEFGPDGLCLKLLEQNRPTGRLLTLAVWNSDRRAGGIAPADQLGRPPSIIEGPPSVHLRHCEPQKRRGNLQQDGSVWLAPINIVYPGFSMLILRSSHPAAAMEIATPYGLAMTMGDGNWSRFAGMRRSLTMCTAERSMPVPYIGLYL